MPAGRPVVDPPARQMALEMKKGDSKLSHRAIAEAIGRTRQQVSNWLRKPRKRKPVW